jgi:hypothetical protein
MRAMAAQSNQAVDCGGSHLAGEESDIGVAVEEMRRGLRPRSHRWIPRSRRPTLEVGRTGVRPGRGDV